MPLERLFTTGSLRLQDSMRFVRAGSKDVPMTPTLMVPDDWSLEAAEAFATSLCTNRPAATQSVEENTMPSWLWRHRALGDQTESEASVLEVFARIAGAATYRGWKNGLWENEIEASVFFDEVQALLLTRRLVFAPQDMARLGLDWAYGLEASPRADHCTPLHHTNALILQNETIDSILRRTQPQASNKWASYLENSLSKPSTHIAFADTVAEWGSLPTHHNVPRAMLNMAAFHTMDGIIDHAALEQATKIAVLLMEIHHDTLTDCSDPARPLALGMGNLAALLMAQALPYDSARARATSATLCALITGTATATSAHLAARLGQCAAFGAQREMALRTLRNKLRATFDEKNDYDHLSILPQTLNLESGVDLVLISAARHANEEALRLAQMHGLRHMQLTSLYEEPELAALMDATSQGIQPETALTCDYAVEDDLFERSTNPAVAKALDKLGYDEADSKAIQDHIVGYRTLVGAPCINHDSLREKGLGPDALDRIEAILPFVDHLRLAFTPWVVGTSFCRSLLGLSDMELQNPHFDMLRHIGFTSQEIAVANAFCCGHRQVKGVLELAAEHASIFDTADTMATEAQLAMAGAVQPFISGDANLHLVVPTALSAELRGEIVIKAWKLGLKGLTMEVDAPYKIAAQDNLPLMKRQSQRLSTGHKKSMQPGDLHALKPKAPSRTVVLKGGTGKHTPLRTKRG